MKKQNYFDSSHAQGIRWRSRSHEICRHFFYQLQGNKAISGGEGGVIFTIESSYHQMINNHHPGHKDNVKLKVAGGINDSKLECIRWQQF